MEQTIIDVVKNLGLPIALILYYLFYVLPNQQKQQIKDDERHDALVDKIINAQNECAEKMNSALGEHTKCIKELTGLIDKKMV